MLEYPTWLVVHYVLWSVSHSFKCNIRSSTKYHKVFWNLWSGDLFVPKTFRHGFPPPQKNQHWDIMTFLHSGLVSRLAQEMLSQSTLVETKQFACLTRQHFSRMRKTHSPTVPVLLASTRCQDCSSSISLMSREERGIPWYMWCTYPLSSVDTMTDGHLWRHYLLAT